MSNLYKNITHRSEMVLGPAVMAELSRTRVIIFGVGGVGGWCAESLVRTGVQNLTIVDSDVVCQTNINRQIQATSLNIGKSKVDEMKVRLCSINPEASITAIHASYDETSFHNFSLESYNYVIDAIDSLKNKILLLGQCVQHGVNVYSSMGAAARTDPSKVKVNFISKTKNCPLARRVRRLLREKNVASDIICVYSEELPVEPAMDTRCGTEECGHADEGDALFAGNNVKSVDQCGMKKQVNGSLVHVTATFGFMLAGLVVEDVMKKYSPR